MGRAEAGTSKAIGNAMVRHSFSGPSERLLTRPPPPTEEQGTAEASVLLPGMFTFSVLGTIEERGD